MYIAMYLDIFTSNSWNIIAMHFAMYLGILTLHSRGAANRSRASANAIFDLTANCGTF